MPQDPDNEQNMRIFSLEDENGLEDEPLDLDEEEIADQPSFEEALEAIQGDTLEPAALQGFSDISRNEARQLAQVWSTLPEDAALPLPPDDIWLRSGQRLADQRGSLPDPRLREAAVGQGSSPHGRRDQGDVRAHRHGRR